MLSGGEATSVTESFGLPLPFLPSPLPASAAGAISIASATISAATIVAMEKRVCCEGVVDRYALPSR